MPDFLQMVLDAGAAEVGCSPLTSVRPEDFRYYQEWIDRGAHGSMSYLGRHLEIRRRPALLLKDPPPDGVGTIISALFPYFSGSPSGWSIGCGASPPAPAPPPSPPLRFARYALGEDYHEAIRRRLRPVAEAIERETGCEARVCIDTAPILERYWAVEAGLGYIGRNHQFISPTLGSYLFIAEIVTSLTITGNAGQPSASPPTAPSTCLKCGRCERACPGGALTPEGFDACRCNSYLTIEHRDALPDGHQFPAGRIYGCDICLEVCPLARPKSAVEILPEFAPRPALTALTPDDIRQLTPEAYSTLLRHSAIKRAKLPQLLRNLRHLPDET